VDLGSEHLGEGLVPTAPGVSDHPPFEPGEPAEYSEAAFDRCESVFDDPHIEEITAEDLLGDFPVVQFLDFDERHPVEVAELERPPAIFGPGFSVSSDGRWILSMHEQEESDLMLVEGFR